MINDMIRTNIKFKFYKLQNYCHSTCLALNKKNRTTVQTSGKTTSPTIKHKSATAIDPTYTTSGRLSCADILLLINLDVFSFETVRFCTMFSIFVCTSLGVKETLVWLRQAHVQSLVPELLNKVDASVREVVGVDSEDKETVVVACVPEVDNEDTLIDIFKMVEALGVADVLKVVDKGCADETIVFVCAFKVRELSVAPVNKRIRK